MKDEKRTVLSLVGSLASSPCGRGGAPSDGVLRRRAELETDTRPGARARAPRPPPARGGPAANLRALLYRRLRSGAEGDIWRVRRTPGDAANRVIAGRCRSRHPAYCRRRLWSLDRRVFSRL